MPITIVIFTDLNCPGCRRLARALDSLKTSKDLAVVERVVAVPGNAVETARPYYCLEAGQAERWRMALLDRRNATLVFDREWGRLAMDVGVGDTSRFMGCVNSGAPPNREASAAQEARKLGIRRLPVVLINDTLMGDAYAVPESLHVRIAALRRRLAHVKP